MEKNKKIRVFLSRPNQFTDEQDYLIKSIKSFFLEKNIETITLQAKHYSPYESLTTLKKKKKRCYGMIILAFGHTYIESGKIKKGGINRESFFESQEKDLNKTWITSTFCQIEGAMAISNKIPILIIKQENLKSDGILKNDEKIFNAQNFNLKSKDSINEYINNFETEQIKSWLEKVYDNYEKIENYII